jgi:hypothetical protein
MYPHRFFVSTGNKGGVEHSSPWRPSAHLVAVTEPRGVEAVEPFSLACEVDAEIGRLGAGSFSGPHPRPQPGERIERIDRRAGAQEKAFSSKDLAVRSLCMTTIEASIAGTCKGKGGSSEPLAARSPRPAGSAWRVESEL